MSSELWRTLIAFINIGLIITTGFLGYQTFFKKSTVPTRERVPKVNPVDFQIKETAIKQRRVQDFTAVWTQLRKPQPKKPVAPVKPTPRPKVNTAIDVISARYDLVGVSINPTNPGRSTCYMKKKGGKSHVLIQVGEKIPETQFTLVALAQGKSTDIKATIKDTRGKTKDIVLRPNAK